MNDLTPERIARDDAIAALRGRPSPRELYARGDIDQGAYGRVSRLRRRRLPSQP